MACVDGEAASIYLQLSGYFTNLMFVFPHSLCLQKCYFCCQGDGFVPCLANKVMCKWLSALQSSWCLCLVGDLGDLGVVALCVCFDAVLTVRLGLLEVFFSLQCILILRN